jgi:hypothetical protein
MANLIPGTAVSLFCAGTAPSNRRLLDGVTRTSNVDLAPISMPADPYTGTRWLVTVPDNSKPSRVSLICLGDISGPRYLNGDTVNGNVNLLFDNLTNNTQNHSGALWDVIDAGGMNIFLKCAGNIPVSDHVFLNGHTADANFKVDLVRNTTDFSGTLWTVTAAQPAPRGGLGITSARSVAAPTLAFQGFGRNRPDAVHMAWADHDTNYLSVMADVLGYPVTCSLAHQCLDRPAIANDGNKNFIAWTGQDHAVNVMSAVDGTNVVFGNKSVAPGRSNLGPAICTFGSAIYVAWIEAATNHVMLWKMGEPQPTDLNETSLSAPALIGIITPDEDGPTIAWAGSDNLRQLNIRIFNSGQKATYPTNGPNGATTSFGPSLAAVRGSDGNLLWILGWTGFPGGPDGRNHLNIMFVQQELNSADGKRTVLPWSSTGPAILQTGAPDGPLVAWVDDGGMINLANYNHLQVIPT